MDLWQGSVRSQFVSRRSAVKAVKMRVETKRLERFWRGHWEAR